VTLRHARRFLGSVLPACPHTCWRCGIGTSTFPRMAQCSAMHMYSVCLLPTFADNSLSALVPVDTDLTPPASSPTSPPPSSLPLAKSLAPLILPRKLFETPLCSSSWVRTAVRPYPTRVAGSSCDSAGKQPQPHRPVTLPDILNVQMSHLTVQSAKKPPAKHSHQKTAKVPGGGWHPDSDDDVCLRVARAFFCVFIFCILCFVVVAGSYYEFANKSCFVCAFAGQ